MGLEKLLRELRLMAAQPGYRFVLAWGVVLMQVVLRYVAVPIGALLIANRFGFF